MAENMALPINTNYGLSGLRTICDDHGISIPFTTEALSMRWTYTPVVGSTPVLGFLPWLWGYPFRGSVTVQINRQEQTCPSLAKGWALPQAMNGMFCNHDPACCCL